MSVKSKILTSIERKTKVDYAYAEKALSNMKISDLLKVTSKEDFDSELTQKIVELQKEYLDLFKGRNYSLKEIQTYMCETFLEYKKEYEKIINDQKVEFSSYSLNKNTYISISPEQIKTLENKLINCLYKEVLWLHNVQFLVLQQQRCMLFLDVHLVFQYQ